MPQHFTPEETNAALTEIRPLVEELVRHRAEQRRVAGERERVHARIAGNGGGIDSERLAELEGEEEQARIAIARTVNAIHGRGAIVKDLDSGLVDFPARRDGEEILLCWQLGEDAVEHWHSLDDGFAGRRRLEDEES